MFHLYNIEIYEALTLLSIVPIAVNSVILASVLNAQPEKAAAAVLFSTAFALLFVPVMIIWLIGDPSAGMAETPIIADLDEPAIAFAT